MWVKDRVNLFWDSTVKTAYRDFNNFPTQKKHANKKHKTHTFDIHLTMFVTFQKSFLFVVVRFTKNCDE